MSSILDVETALVNLAAEAVYPNGTAQPSVANIAIAVRPGWPNPSDLDTELAAGKARVSIYPMPGMVRNTSRFPQQWLTVSRNPATIVLTVSGKTVTAGGTVSTPQNCMVVVNGQPYAYAVQSNDSINSIAANIAALIAGASAVGTVITIPSAYRLEARVGTTGIAGKELKRQQAAYMITTWAPTPTVRNLIAEAVDIAFADTDFLTMPDGFAARLLFQGYKEQDHLQKARIYRRDLNYLVEFATTKTETEYTITYPFINSITAKP